ncbi:response regulator transcription factor [Kordiimonas sp. SCSIO 12610]|uniref:response regulator transcription factor n=1 Tax=Kordiimonas sp. SCSIO 12610 TaxID=2829597 RepID=UPI00210A123F|nr:response regulator transcription factor [Kordiimonas sp. SCSIO 12610]UTW54505.1 response regulator transcription factor [Kordiimonas sp. SCSIO 12610]
MKALIIDSEELFRLGVKHLLKAANDFDEIIEISADRELLSLPVTVSKEVTITIVNPMCFPDMQDIFWRPIQQICPNSKILAIVEDGFNHFEKDGINFVPRGISAHHMASLIQDNLSTRSRFDAPSIVEPIVESPKPLNPDQNLSKNFSKRRLQILEMAANGLSNKDIAVELNIAEGTVKAHMHLIMKMLDVSNRTQAALWYQSQYH